MKSIPVKTETQIYNEMVTATMANIISLSREDNTIVLKNFEYWFDSHKTFLTIANYVSCLYNREFYIDVNWLDYFRLKRMFKNYSFSKAKRKHKKGISVPHEIIHICNSFGVGGDTFDVIWEEFYKPRKEENNEN